MLRKQIGSHCSHQFMHSVWYFKSFGNAWATATQNNAKWLIDIRKSRSNSNWLQNAIALPIVCVQMIAAHYYSWAAACKTNKSCFLLAFFVQQKEISLNFNLNLSYASMAFLCISFSRYTGCHIFFTLIPKSIDVICHGHLKSILLVLHSNVRKMTSADNQNEHSDEKPDDFKVNKLLKRILNTEKLQKALEVWYDFRFIRD